MFASRLFVSFLALGAIAVSASPTTLEKRDISSVLDIITTLGNTVAPHVANLNGQAASGAVTTSSVTAPISSIVSALSGASGALSGLGLVSTSGGSAADVAGAVSPILTDVVSSLGAVDDILPIAGLLGELGLQIALNEIIEGLVITVDGVLNLISGLLISVAGILSTLGLTLTLLLLGLGL